MFESANSSFFQQDAVVPEMKLIYDILQESEGVYGARASGIRFRRGVIELVDPEYKETIKEKVDSIYPKESAEIKSKYEVNFCKVNYGARFADVEDIL